MLKPFVTSPLLGALAASMGWIGAILLKDNMSARTFADLPGGWAGLMIGCIAAATVLLLLMAGKMADPLITSIAAGAGAAVYWGRQDLPFATANFENGTNGTYWFAVTTMVLVLILLLLGLRVARDTNQRARG